MPGKLTCIARSRAIACHHPNQPGNETLLEEKGTQTDPTEEPCFVGIARLFRKGFERVVTRRVIKPRAGPRGEIRQDLRG